VPALDPPGGRRHRLADQLAQGVPDAGQPIPFGQCPRTGTGHDNGVGTGGKTQALLRKRLSQQPLDAIALDGSPDLARDRQSEARVLAVSARKDMQDELTTGMRTAGAEDAVEVGTAG